MSGWRIDLPGGGSAVIHDKGYVCWRTLEVDFDQIDPEIERVLPNGVISYGDGRYVDFDSPEWVAKVTAYFEAAGGQ